MKRRNISRKVEHRLERMMNDIPADLLSTLVYNTSASEWVLFNKYTISKTADESFLVGTIGNTMTAKRFNRLRNAATWVVLYEQNRVYDANRVQELDTLIAGLEVERAQHSRLKTSKNTEQYLIQLSKLSEATAKQKQFLAEIDKYNIKAKISQLRGFENATKRISRE